MLSTTAAVVTALRLAARPDGVTCMDMADASGYSRRGAHAVLRRLEAQGAIRRDAVRRHLPARTPPLIVWRLAH